MSFLLINCPLILPNVGVTSWSIDFLISPIPEDKHVYVIKLICHKQYQDSKCHHFFEQQKLAQAFLDVIPSSVLYS